MLPPLKSQYSMWIWTFMFDMESSNFLKSLNCFGALRFLKKQWKSVSACKPILKICPYFPFLSRETCISISFAGRWVRNQFLHFPRYLKCVPSLWRGGSLSTLLKVSLDFLIDFSAGAIYPALRRLPHQQHAHSLSLFQTWKHQLYFRKDSFGSGYQEPLH